ncbi:MAG: aminotransferase class V-fold PLP-dependent enzyme [Actinomycetia bacterium]|nr:aminotransferase class V-fold PLP-dependent enzyme [Actinomycetes bacterium]
MQTEPDLDLDFVRSQFPAFGEPSLKGWAFFENAGGSYACGQTIEALTRYYRETKVQPYAPYPASMGAGEAMDRSRVRWAEALGVATDEVQFGPSTSMNTYVLANAFGALLGPSDRVIVTNQDHEANTGAIRRAAKRAGAELVEWQVDPQTGLLDIEHLADLLSANTKLVTVPHCSNLVGMENDVATITSLAHDQGARVIVDGVSFAPHGLRDIAALDADIYLFSLYKTYSVHQGLMVTRNGILDELGNQGHDFNRHLSSKRLTPAGPDHAQEAAAGAVLDYMESLAHHHGVPAQAGLREVVADCTVRWQQHEAAGVGAIAGWLASSPAVRLVGVVDGGDSGLHRCPTVAFQPLGKQPAEVVDALVANRIMCGAGDFYAPRLLQGIGIDPDPGVVRVSWVHYTSGDEVSHLLDALTRVLS